MFLWSLALLNVALTLVLPGRLAAFAKRHPTLSNHDDLDQYRSLITVHMWGVLGLMAIALLLPIGVVAPSILSRGYAGVDWWPVAVLGIPVLFRSQIRAIETRCRCLQVSSSLAAEYAGINQVWTGKALPRFPTSVELASGGSTPGASSSHEAIRADGFDDELTLRRNAYVMTALGLGDAIFGLLAVLDEKLPELHGFAGVLLVVGVTTFIGGMLLTWRLRIGYHISLVCAALHVLLPPIGTVFGIWMLVSTRRAQYGVSPEYLEALSREQVPPARPWLRYLLLGVVIVHVHGFTLFAASLFILMSARPS